MLAIPADLSPERIDAMRVSAAARVVGYRARVRSEKLATLFTQPTLVRVLRGTKVLHAPGGRSPLVVSQGRTVLMPTGVRWMSEFLTEDGNYESTVVAFAPAFLANINAPPQSGRLGRARAACLLEPMPGVDEVVAELPRLLEVQADERLLELRLEELVLRLMGGPRALQRILADGARVGHGAGSRLRAVMQQHFHEPLQLADFARLCERSLASFKRDFRRVYGESPGAWLSEHRLRYAAQLLADDTRSVTEVCFACGYGNLSNFIRAFSRRYEVSPTQWRAQHHA